MPESVHPKAGNEVEVLFAIEVVKKNSLAAFYHDGVAIVGLQEEEALAVDDVLGAHNANNSKRQTVKEGSYELLKLRHLIRLPTTGHLDRQG